MNENSNLTIIIRKLDDIISELEDFGDSVNINSSISSIEIAQDFITDEIEG